MNRLMPDAARRVRALTVLFTVLSLAVACAHAQPLSLQQSREEALKKITSARGAAASAPVYSRDYPQRIRDAIRVNLLLAGEIEGNPTAEVEVRTRPDGVIASFVLRRSSGNVSWDDAVLRAVETTGRIPRDVSGAVPPVLVLAFRPK